MARESDIINESDPNFIRGTAPLETRAQVLDRVRSDRASDAIGNLPPTEAQVIVDRFEVGMRRLKDEGATPGFKNSPWREAFMHALGADRRLLMRRGFADEVRRIDTVDIKP